MKIKHNKLLVFTFLLIAFSLFSFDASAQNFPLRSCAGQNPPVKQAGLSITKEGAINILTCAGQPVLLNGALLEGTGTVTSVDVALPGIFSVAGSPVTTTGTITATLTSQSQNLIFASPNGSSGVPLFRSLVAADIPTLNQNTTGTAASVTGATQSSITSIPNLATVGTITSGTWSGSFGAISGANLTSLNASNLASGTVGTARLGSGTANSTTFLRGDGIWAVASTGNFTDAVNNFVDLTFTPSTATASKFRYEGRGANLVNASNSREFQILDAGSTVVFAAGNTYNVSVNPLGFKLIPQQINVTTALVANDSGKMLWTGGGREIQLGTLPAGFVITIANLNQGGGTNTIKFLNATSFYNLGAAAGSPVTINANGTLSGINGTITLMQPIVGSWVLVTNSGNAVTVTP